MLRSVFAALFAVLLGRPRLRGRQGHADAQLVRLRRTCAVLLRQGKGLLLGRRGIDLEIQEGRGSGTVTQVVAAKTVQFGYVDVPTMMRAAVKGAPVVAIGVALQTNPMSAMGFADKNIRKPEDIKGKTVATTPGDSMSQIWPLFLKKTGLKESDFKTVSGDATTKLNAVINGQADLLLGYVMDQSMKIKDATGKDVLSDQVLRITASTW